MLKAARDAATKRFCMEDEHVANEPGLLMTHDRVGGDTLLLTQEYLATMLGVRTDVPVEQRDIDGRAG